MGDVRNCWALALPLPVFAGVALFELGVSGTEDGMGLELRLGYSGEFSACTDSGMMESMTL